MVIIELKYKKSLAVVDKHIAAHREWLKQNFDAGLFILSGPKHPRTGGVIVATCDYFAALELIKKDPFYPEIAEYNLIQFDAAHSGNIVATGNKAKASNLADIMAAVQGG